MPIAWFEITVFKTSIYSGMVKDKPFIFIIKKGIIKIISGIKNEITGEAIL